PRVEPGVAGDAALHDFAQRRQELPRFGWGDDARERLLDDLVWTEAEKRKDGVIGLQDFSLEVRHEHGVRRVLDQALGVGSGLVQFSHVAQDSDDTDRPAIRTTEGGGVEARRDDLAARTARVQDDVPHDTSLDHFPQRRPEFPSFLRTDEARQGLLQYFILTEPEQLG